MLKSSTTSLNNISDINAEIVKLENQLAKDPFKDWTKEKQQIEALQRLLYLLEQLGTEEIPFDLLNNRDETNQFTAFPNNDIDIEEIINELNQTFSILNVSTDRKRSVSTSSPYSPAFLSPKATSGKSNSHSPDEKDKKGEAKSSHKCHIM